MRWLYYGHGTRWLFTAATRGSKPAGTYEGLHVGPEAVGEADEAVVVSGDLSDEHVPLLLAGRVATHDGSGVRQLTRSQVLRS